MNKKTLNKSTTDSPDDIYSIVSDVKNNDTLVISEKAGRVFLPYTINELKAYMNEYPEEYKSLSDIVNQEFIVPIIKYKNQTISRFRETYFLYRDIEMNSIITSFKKSVSMMMNSKVHPAIIAACKSEEQLNDYIYCLEHNCMNNFKDFKIVFEVAPTCTGMDNFLNFESYITSKGKHAKEEL